MRVVSSKLFGLALRFVLPMYSYMKGFEMRFNSQKLALLSLFLVVVPLIGRAWAAFGPCVVYRAAGTAPVPSPIGCYQNTLKTLTTCFCGGSIALVPEASSCSNANSVPCTEVNVEALITYGSDGSNCLTWTWSPIPVPWGMFYPTCGGACFQDLTTAWPTWSTPKDTSCT